MSTSPLYATSTSKVFKDWYKILLYIGGAILILSLFIEPRGLNSIYVITFSAWSVLIGLLIWLLEDSISVICDYYSTKHKKGKYQTKSLLTLFTALTYFRYFIHIIAFISWAVFVFPVLFYE